MNPWPPVRYGARLLREGGSIAASYRVPSLVTGLVAAGVTLTVLATTGQDAATQTRVLSSLSGLDARIIQITDTDGQAAISPATVNVLQSTSGVAGVIGLGPAQDVHVDSLGDGGKPVPLRAVYGALPAELAITQGHVRPGQVIVGSRAQAKLGLQQPAGGLNDANDQEYAVSGSFHGTDYLAYLDRSALIREQPTKGSVVSDIFVLAATPEDIDSLIKALPGAVVAAKGTYTVTASQALIKARDAVSTDLSDAARDQLLLVLLAAVALQAITMAGAVSQRRRDFGRRRSLGASRSAIVVLVLTQTLVPALLGAIAGTGIGMLVVQRLTDALPPSRFTLGVAVLAVLAAGAAAIPPALLAAIRDPVRILRVP